MFASFYDFLLISNVLWDSLSTYIAVILCIIVTGNTDKYGLEDLLNTRPDISDYIYFHFYDTIKYYDDGPYQGNVENF